ncbi:MAG: helix-turn-helix domain-containing protein [Lachnospiraceae bacterium]|nr:helix-turn-helix domain-containing protein [Lachnospiraceae bacterium]
MKQNNQTINWSVLVVDDQINVVEGVIRGINWEQLGVKKVHRAYSASEAKTILLQNPVDIMLCDIEMPRENGLSLFRWTRDQSIPLECIFLTSHADFLYAKSAIQLGSFDYILQPARYSEIESALLKAAQKILARREQEKYCELGKSVFENQIRVTDDLFRSWYLDPLDAVKQEKLRICLNETDRNLYGSTQVEPILLQVFSWHKGIWEKELFRYSCRNVLEELFNGKNVSILCHCLEADFWGFWLWSEDGEWNEDGIGILEQFHQVASSFFGCDMAVYVGKKTEFQSAGAVLTELIRQKENNVAMKSRLFLPDEAVSPGKKAVISEPDYHTWEVLLQQNCGQGVCADAVGYLDKAAAAELLDANRLQAFYHRFVRMLIRVEEAASVKHEEIFPTEQQREDYLNAYENLVSMKELIKTACSFFAGEEDEKKTAVQIEQIREYVYHHLDQEIRREDVAAAVFLNPSYVSRIFKKETGISLKDFILQEKMKMARILLKSTALPISIVAQRVGYTNFSHFSQVYRKIYGISPTEERK